MCEGVHVCVLCMWVVYACVRMYMGVYACVGVSGLCACVLGE